MQKGISEPNEILEHLMKSAVNPEASDKIGINKDGINSKDTYYNHIRTLFSLFLLENEMQTVMRGLVFVS